MTNAHLVTPAVLEKLLVDAVAISPLKNLGAVIGRSSYFGQCLAGCCQFHSTWDRVAEVSFSYGPGAPGLTYQRTVCSSCHGKIAARLPTR